MNEKSAVVLVHVLVQMLSHDTHESTASRCMVRTSIAVHERQPAPHQRSSNSIFVRDLFAAAISIVDAQTHNTSKFAYCHRFTLRCKCAPTAGIDEMNASLAESERWRGAEKLHMYIQITDYRVQCHVKNPKNSKWGNKMSCCSLESHSINRFFGRI